MSAFIDSETRTIEINSLGTRCFNAWSRAGFGLPSSSLEEMPNVKVSNGLNWKQIEKLFAAAGIGRVQITTAGNECIEKVKQYLQSQEKN